VYWYFRSLIVISSSIAARAESNNKKITFAANALVDIADMTDFRRHRSLFSSHRLRLL